MMRLTGWCTVALALTALAASGCNDTDKTSGRVAVVDLDKIATGIGEIKRINEAIAVDVKSARTQLEEFKKNLQAEMDKAAKEIGDTPSEPQKQELAKRRAIASQRLAAATRSTDQQVRARRDAALKGFRDEVTPIAGQVARKKGMSIVLTKVLPVLWNDGAIDITDEVLEEVTKLQKVGRFGSARQPGAAPAAKPGS